MSHKYFGEFSDRESVAFEFDVGTGRRWHKSFRIDPSFPTDDEFLIASYEYESYSGYAFVLFEEGGQLYEVHGSHCSCYGLEGQWEPEVTSWEALIARVENAGRWDHPISTYGYHSQEAHDLFRDLLEKHDNF